MLGLWLGTVGSVVGHYILGAFFASSIPQIANTYAPDLYLLIGIVAASSGAYLSVANRTQDMDLSYPGYV